MAAIDPITLMVKMAIAATIVVSVSIIAEKTKPFIAAMVATLPVSAGPTLIFLALLHDDAFMAAAMHGSLVQNISTGIFCLTYAIIAQRRGTLVSLVSALSIWILSGLVMRQIGLGLMPALAFTLAGYGVLIPFMRRYREAPMPAVPPRPWYAIPMRAAMVSILVAVVTGLSSVLGGYGSGFLAVFPIVMTSLALILHPRIGGAATANVFASGMAGLMGFGVALAIGSALATTIGGLWAVIVTILVCILWNGGLVILSRRSA